jgi:hypothetical protein
MAHLNQRRSQNVNGDFYVDTTCIDCDTTPFPHSLLALGGFKASLGLSNDRLTPTGRGMEVGSFLYSFLIISTL